MAVALLSPGVLIREVDLTVGRAENVLDNIGGICGPFQKGPVDDPYTVETEQELIEEFGKPIGTDAQYEYWMSASSFLSYGGVLKVVRTDGATLNNANAGVDTRFDTTLKIKNYDDYKENYQTDTGWNYAAKTPGKWANGLKLCFIDDLGRSNRWCYHHQSCWNGRHHWLWCYRWSYELSFLMLPLEPSPLSPLDS